MLVAAPSAFKTTMLSALDVYPNAHLASDLNLNSIVKLRDNIASSKIRSVTLLDYQKIWERDPRTAANVEGSLRALVGEGFTQAAYQDERMQTLKARCVVMGAMTSDFYREHFTQWEHNGYARRFLWFVYGLANPDVALDSIEEWVPLKFGWNYPPLPRGGRMIPQCLTETERAELRHLIRDQVGDAIPLMLSIKIASVLKHYYSLTGDGEDKAMVVMREFARGLSKHGTLVHLCPNQEKETKLYHPQPTPTPAPEIFTDPIPSRPEQRTSPTISKSKPGRSGALRSLTGSGRTLRLGS